MRARRSAMLAVLASVAACSGGDASKSTASASAAASVPGVAMSSSSAPSAAPVGDPKRARTLLIEGRKLEKDEQWKEAQAKLSDALALAPDDVAILAELGWAALHAGDLDASKRASEHALEIAHEPRTRAQILYNLGRVLEAKGDKAGAKKRYEDSLGMRPSKSVEERLEGLGGTAPAPPPAPELPCQRTFSNTAALCACLSPTHASEPDACAVNPAAPVLESGELEVVRAATETDGETVLFLVANEGGGVKPVSELGRDYHPGAFGVDNTTKVLGIDEQKLGGKSIAVVRTEVVDKDTNAGGLEVSLVRAKRSTVCVLRQNAESTRCPLVVPTEIDDSLSFPKDDASLTPEQKAYVAAHVASAHDFHLRLTVKLTAKGVAEVTLEQGDEKRVPRGLLGKHPLF